MGVYVCEPVCGGLSAREYSGVYGGGGGSLTPVAPANLLRSLSLNYFVTLVRLALTWPHRSPAPGCICFSYWLALRGKKFLMSFFLHASSFLARPDAHGSPPRCYLLVSRVRWFSRADVTFLGFSLPLENFIQVQIARYILYLLNAEFWFFFLFFLTLGSVNDNLNRAILKSFSLMKTFYTAVRIKCCMAQGISTIDSKL